MPLLLHMHECMPYFPCANCLTDHPLYSFFPKPASVEAQRHTPPAMHPWKCNINTNAGPHAGVATSAVANPQRMLHSGLPAAAPVAPAADACPPHSWRGTGIRAAGRQRQRRQRTALTRLPPCSRRRQGLQRGVLACWGARALGRRVGLRRTSVAADSFGAQGGD